MKTEKEIKERLREVHTEVEEYGEGTCDDSVSFPLGQEEALEWVLEK